MGWALKEKVRAHKITEALAKKFRDMDGAPHDRPLKAVRMAAYRRVMNEGGFRPVTWASAFCIETQSWFRVNGKHTATLACEFFEAGKPFDLDAIVETYECDTLRDIADLYSTFDSRMMSRTAADIYKQYARVNPVLVAVSDQLVCLAAPAMAYAQFPEDTYTCMSPQERGELLCESPGTEFTLWLEDLLGNTGKNDTQPCKRAMRKLGVVAAMFSTWGKCKSGATAFWRLVRDEGAPTANDPTRKLARFIVSTGLYGFGHTEKGMGRGKARRAGIMEFYAKSITGWNAWRRGENTNLNFFADKKPPSPV